MEELFFADPFLANFLEIPRSIFPETDFSGLIFYNNEVARISFLLISMVV